MESADLFRMAANGDEAAEAFLATFVDVCHFFDDVADGDQVITRRDVEEALWKALVLLPSNSFYRKHFDRLNPLIIVACHNWLTANDMEDGGQEDQLRIAFILRSSYVDLVTMVATICGGIEHGRIVCNVARPLVHGEGWDAYLANLTAEKATREQRHVSQEVQGSGS